MPEVRFPRRKPRLPKKSQPGSIPAHRKWVASHHCSVPGCNSTPIECAHVRRGSDGGMGLKPSDIWTVSLCRDHHAEQHRTGETSFEQKYDLSLLDLAKEFARRSPCLARRRP
ncbi:putative HNHc nuclease [Sphingomonas flavescens]|uniref:DUF968 domain-containing protein n=1 Tax=Sphingomonas flavescens TaxID=3132797 RepID=UPI0028063606|nr:putative HNHc nuclease [Sphingomonas limnosediminicola]